MTCSDVRSSAFRSKSQKDIPVFAASRYVCKICNPTPTFSESKVAHGLIAGSAGLEDGTRNMSQCRAVS